MRKYLWAVVLLAASGCTTDMENVMKDPHFSKYEEEQNALEHAYLQKEIPYSDYEARRKEIQAKYEQEVEEREQKISE